MTTTHSPIRIAILECDEPIGRTKEKYGGYGNLFAELLDKGASEWANTTAPGDGGSAKKPERWEPPLIGSEDKSSPVVAVEKVSPISCP